MRVQVFEDEAKRRFRGFRDVTLALVIAIHNITEFELRHVLQSARPM